MASKKVYNVIFTEDAVDDLDGIYLYIKQQLFSEKAALEKVLRIEKSIRNLSLYPFSANLVLDEVLQEKGYRKLVIIINCRYFSII